MASFFRQKQAQNLARKAIKMINSGAGGGGSTPALPSVVIPKQTAKILGDSITFQNIVAGHFSDRGYFVWANALLGQMFDFAGNFGVSGQRSDEILARVDTDIINTNKPGICFVLAGVNDISQQATKNTTAEGTFTNIRTIYEKLTAAGIRIIALTVPASSSWTTDTQKAMYFKLNEYIKAYARSNPNVILIDTASAYLDPTTVGPVTGMTVDGTHPSAAGAYRLGRLIAAEVIKHFTIQPTSLVYSNVDPANYLANATFTGTAGTKANVAATGDVADGWIVAGYTNATVVASKVPRTLMQGDMQQLRITGDSATSNGYIYRDQATTIAAGEMVYGQIKVQLPAGTKLTNSLQFGIDARNVVNGTGTSLGTYFSLFHESQNPDLNVTLDAPLTLTLRTPSFAVPATTNQFRFSLRIYSTDATVQVDVAEIRKVI